MNDADAKEDGSLQASHESSFRKEGSSLTHRPSFEQVWYTLQSGAGGAGSSCGA